MSDTASVSSQPAAHPDVKQCCAAFYGSDYARFLLGDSFHPGGTKLTHELGERLALSPASTVLDVASGRGTSAVYLAQTFGCKVVGLDLSSENVRLSQEAANSHGRQALLSFEVGDAESLPFDDASFTAIICECAFCTFPDKSKAANEFFRVLRPTGQVGLTDLTKAAETPRELQGLLAWIACIGDAQPVDSYASWLVNGGFTMDAVLDRSECLREMVEQVRGRMLLAEVMVGLKKLSLPNLDLTESKGFMNAVSNALQRGDLGYALLTANKPS